MTVNNIELSDKSKHISHADNYAVFGNPIEHSKSPIIHAMFAEQTQQLIEYQKILVAKEKFVETATHFFKEGGKGLNITVPFKQEAFDFAEALTQRAKLAGAVNTLSLQDDGSVLGDNTDGVGMVEDMINRHKWIIRDKKILVLGAGGAVRGVLYPLLQQLPKTVTIVNRTFSKAKNIAEEFSVYGDINACSFDELNDNAQAFDIVINGSSAGLSNAMPALSKALVHDQSCAYDMVYSNETTVFLSWAKKQGVKYLADGIGMLVGQAAESFYIWRKVKPEVNSVITFLCDNAEQK